MSGPGRPLYDDPAFFRRYQRMRARGGGLNEELEQPAVIRMLPPVGGADVLEIGCGDGQLARWLAGRGARRVLGVDPSARMLGLAAARGHPRVRYCQASADTLELAPGRLDVVVSSLALHYVADYSALIGRVAGWLRPGGHLVYSVEHPVRTARNPMTGWAVTADGATVWPVDDYAAETARRQVWLDTVVTKYHRRLTTLVGAVLAAGLELTGLDEPYPDERMAARRPDLAPHRRSPPLLVVAARRPG